MTNTQLSPSATSDLAGLAAQAFIYGFPLVFDLGEVGRALRDGIGLVPPVALNEFGHARQLAGPETRFVSINNDTVYSMAMVDVSGGPVQLSVPDTAGRYYVLQFIDAWTDNFAYVGHRATGTEAGEYILVAPDWTGEAPAGTTVIRCPTTIVTIVARWAVAGDADLPTVHALQDQMTLTATSADSGIPEPDASVPEPLRFYEQLRVGLRAFPPAERDRVYQERFAPLGLLEPESPYADAEPSVVTALTDGLAQGRQMLENALKHSPIPKQNGWDLTYHIFDYNLDFFEVGTLDSSQWKLPEGEVRYMQRAGAARGGLWGNHAYEAAYPMIYVDSDGQALSGSHQYRLRFSSPPPCGAFWSITMYDATDFFLVANPIDRYSIGDRTRGLVTHPDGSLTIALQHDQPEDLTLRANWLPTPQGAFRPLLRIYEPDPAVFDGSWQLPPITRVTAG